VEQYIPTALAPCADYEPRNVRKALLEVLEASGGLDWVKSGMRIGIKLNLCAGLKPESAAVTHPVMAAELVKILTERGAKVVLGDSPGEPFSGVVLNRIYNVTGMKLCEQAGGELNSDYSYREVEYPEAKILRKFSCTSWLLDCDAIINFCKLKSHGMMGMTAAVKNTYGIIPGTQKSETHFRYSNPMDFANLLIDLSEFIEPVLHICDAVDAMEGNGPTQGTPRHMGLIIAGHDPYQVDRLCARLIGVREDEIPYLIAAKHRGLLAPDAEPENMELAAPYCIKDFKRSGATSSWFYQTEDDGLFRLVIKKALALALRSRPKLYEGCIGCGHCVKMCPAKAIVIKNGRAVIDRGKCVRCFCCQEFCPTGAMQVHRTFIARLVQR